MVETVACQRSHTTHTSRPVHIDLSTPHGYHDLPQIPAHLAFAFTMEVWDPSVHPVDADPRYCPAHDCVSEAIVNQHIWEPCETAAVLSCCDGHDEETFLDFGAHLGWFSILAASRGLDVTAYEPDPDNLRLLKSNLGTATPPARVIQRFIGPRSRPFTRDDRIRLVKADVEGYEFDVVRILSKLLEEGRVDHLLLEVSPVFKPGYGQLVDRLRGWGYIPHILPDKTPHPAPFVWPDSLTPFTATAQEIDALHQTMCWFKHVNAAW